uniref:Pseudouridine synthase I TruA alpha/beta domain-containing protein n=2 Tax=Araucaria cunninghamii TaxID=56994 RepID=A0A0D6QW55_ARACU
MESPQAGTEKEKDPIFTPILIAKNSCSESDDNPIVVEQKSTAAKDPKTQNHAHSSSTADDVNPTKKRPRDQPEMSEIQDPPDKHSEMAKPTEQEKASKLAKPSNVEETKEAEEGEDEEEGAPQEHHHRPPKPKRRKIAILVAYCGVGYQGMQRNPGAKTIEGDLEEALFKAGAISQDMYGHPRMVDWMRSARTDKGVSAVGQVVSGRFIIDPPGLVERVNSHLPEQIRVLAYKRVTPSFSAKKFCDRRRYEYVLPVFALDPAAHRDRESVLASAGKEGALAKCLECSERGRKVVGIMGKQNENGNKVDLNNRTVSENETNERALENHDMIVVDAVSNDKMSEKTLEHHSTIFVSALNDRTLESHGQTRNPSSEELDTGESGLVRETDDFVHGAKSPNGKSNHLEAAMSDFGFDKDALLKECEPEEVSVGQSDGEAVNRTFSYGEKERERFNRILKKFVGTHNFHNLTTRTKAEDPSANRYILSFEASDVHTIDGMDFVRCTVVGQSFMLHQIRKMMGLAVAVMRGCAPESIIDTSLRKDVHMNVPTAPELGLFLDESFFPAYNQKWQATHEEISLKGFEQQILEFKQKYIYKHIASTEVKDGVVALWLHSLNQRNYPDFVAAKELGKLQNGTESSVPVPKESTADKEVIAN